MQFKKSEARNIKPGDVIQSCDGNATVKTVSRFGDKYTIIATIGKRELKIKTYGGDLIPIA